DLTHLDARLERTGQVLDQFAKVDPLLGQEVKDDPFATKQVLDVDQLHLQAAVSDEALTGLHFAPLRFPQAFQGRAILVGQAADDSAVRRISKELDGSWARRAEHLADLQAAVGADDDVVAAPERRLGVQLERSQETHGAVANNQL